MYEEMFYDIQNEGFVLEASEPNPENFIRLTFHEYEQLLLEQSSGKVIKLQNGKVVAVFEQKDLITAERNWRNAELFRADIELNKVQDADLKAKGSVSDWRNYRKALRALPEHSDFPSKSARPLPPDQV